MRALAAAMMVPVLACSDSGAPGADGRLDATRDGRAEGGRSDLPTVGPDGGGASIGSVELAVAGRVLRLAVLADELVRVRYLPPGGKPHPERGWTTLPSVSWPAAKLALRDAGDHWSYRTTRLELRVAKLDAALSFFDLSGRPLSEDVPGQTGGGNPRTLRKRLAADEHFYALGEKTGPLDKRGSKLEMWNTDPLYPKPAYTPTADPLYQSHPFLIGLREGRAYGLYLASSFRTRFDLGASVSDEIRLETEGGDLEYFFLAGPEVRSVVEGYTGKLVGRTPLPPLWALGYHQSRWSYFPDSKLRQIASELRARAIPCDGLWL